MIVRRRFEFEAAHRLPNHPGKCRELHGHSYGLFVKVDRPVDDTSGMAIDFSDATGSFAFDNLVYNVPEPATGSSAIIIVALTVLRLVRTKRERK